MTAAVSCSRTYWFRRRKRQRAALQPASRSASTAALRRHGPAGGSPGVVHLGEQGRQIARGVQAFHRQGTLPRCGNHRVRLENLGDQVKLADPGQPCVGEAPPRPVPRKSPCCQPGPGIAAHRYQGGCPGRISRNWAARRGEPVPTIAPEERSASLAPSLPTSASLGSSRAGTAARRMPGSGAVGRSLSECTARSTSPCRMPSRRALTKTPVPPMSGRWTWVTSPNEVSPTSSTCLPVRGDGDSGQLASLGHRHGALAGAQPQHRPAHLASCSGGASGGGPSATIPASALVTASTAPGSRSKSTRSASS